jgi:hypothetical protein
VHSFERRDRERDIAEGRGPAAPTEPLHDEIVLVEGELVPPHAEAIEVDGEPNDSPRTELGAILAERQRCCPSRGRAEADAAAILAAGYRPPARELTAPDPVERADELDALPIGSIVLHSECTRFPDPCVWARYVAAVKTTDAGNIEFAYWGTPHVDDDLYTSADLVAHFDAQLGGSLVVVHEPEAP